MAKGMAQTTLPEVFGGGPGYEPYYGGEPTGKGLEYLWGLTGFKHWARSAWAKIFDPKFFLESGTSQDYAEAAEWEPLIQHNIEMSLPWEDWIEKITGITSREAAQSVAAAQAAIGKEPLELIPVVSGIYKRTVGQALWTGLGLFGTLDYISRRGYAVGKTLEEVADATSKLPGLPHYGDGRDIFILQTTNPLTGGGFGAIKNVLRIATSGRYDPAQFMETFDRNMRSANFIYTLVQDEVKAHEFARRVASSETPEFIGMEIQNPWVELAGSIVFDPLTYLGASIVTSLPKITKGMKLGEVLFKAPFTKIRIPTLTEAFFPKVAGMLGPGRIPKMADRFFEFADPSLNSAAQRLGSAIDDTDAIKIFTNYSDELEKSVHEARLPRAFIMNSSSRAAAAAEDATIVLQTVTSHTKNPNETLELLKGWHHYLHGTPDQKAAAVATLLHVGPGKTSFSEAGLATGELVSRLYDNGNITKIIEKYGDDSPEFATQLGKAVEKAASDLYPSVDEMAEAAAAVAKGTKGKRIEELAELYREVSPQAKVAQWAQNTLLAKTWRASIGAFTNVYLGLSPTGYPIKNIMGQAPMIAATMGPETAAKISAESLAGISLKSTLGKGPGKLAQGILDKTYAAITDMLGYVPEAATRSMTPAGIMGGWGGMANAQIGENIASAEIVRGMAAKTIQDALRGGTILGTNEIAALKGAGFTDEMLAIMMKGLLDSNGKPEKAIEVLREVTKSGNLELWRTAEPPKVLREFLEKYNFHESFKEIQRTAITEIEFQQRMQKLIKSILRIGDLAALEPVAADVGIAAGVDVAEALALAAEGVIDPSTANRVTTLAQAWENMRRKANLIFTEIASVLANRNPDTQAVRQSARAIAEVQNTFTESYGKTRGLIDKANYLYRSPTRTVPELWKDAVWVQNGKQIWSLAEEFPKVDPTKITRAKFNNFLWTSVFEKRSSMWRASNLLSIDAQVSQLEGMAKASGTTLDKLVQELWPDSNPLNDIAKLKKQAETLDALYTGVDSRVLAAQKFPPGTTLDDLVRDPKLIEQDLPSIRGGIRQLFNSVNKDRRLAGLAEYASYGDVPIEEALAAGAKRSGIVAPAIGKHTDWIEAAVKKFGITENPLDSRYILPDGQMLNFKKEGKLLDHALIGQAVPASAYEFTTKTGSIRIRYEEILNGKRLLLEISAAPTNAQVRTIKDALAVSAQGGSFGWDITKPTGQILSSGLVNNATELDVDKIVATAKSLFEARVVPLVPAAAKGMPPTVARGIYESADAIEAAMQKYTDGVVSSWGKTVSVSSLTDAQEEALSAWKKLADSRMAIVRGKAAAIGSGTRDFILYPYRKTPADTLTAYFAPYHYWYGRTYMRWLETVLHNPTIAAYYLKYKNFLAAEHAGLPDWWKNTIPISNVFGIELDHPLLFNLEASVNPLNGLTGVDFVDPHKRVDWLSRVVDDMGSFGPSLYTPISWAVALDMSLKGEEEARAHWMGRVFPITTAIRAIGHVAGVGNVETDPFVNWFSGGIDPYERNRVGRALGSFAEEGKYTEEQTIEASHSQEGSIWDEGVNRAVDERAWGQILSFFAGVGYRPRTASDMRIDQFYQEQRNLLSLSPDLSPEDYRRAWDMLRGKYPFGDAVILAKRGGSDRDTAYAYSVLGRIPPGQMDDLLDMLGIGNDIIDKFYQGKGTFEGWTEGDRMRFMGSIVDLGAMLQIPDYATKQQWTTARETYQNMLNFGEQQFGKNIWDLTDHYLNLDKRNEKDNFLVINPIVEQALDWRQAYVINNATLYPYYGSIESIQYYYRGLVKDELIRKFGSDIYDKFDYYGNLKLTDQKAASAYYKAHPELKEYSVYRDTIQDMAIRALVRFVKYLPERPNVPLRPEFIPQTPTQEQLAIGVQPQPRMTVQDYITNYGISDVLWRLTKAYLDGDKPLPYAVSDQLDYLARAKGEYGTDLLQKLAIAYLNP